MLYKKWKKGSKLRSQPISFWNTDNKVLGWSPNTVKSGRKKGFKEFEGEAWKEIKGEAQKVIKAETWKLIRGKAQKQIEGDAWKTRKKLRNTTDTC